MSVAHAEPQSFDQANAEAFADRVADMLNTGAITSMVSVGHRSGLFNVLATLPPSTSDQIAAAATLDERYVREWLAIMVTGRIVDYDSDRETYHLPAEHAACLTKSAALGNLAVYGQFVVQISQLQDRILECFESGDGLAYGDYPHFHTMMAEDSEQTVASRIFDTILPLVPGIEARLQAGIDVMDAGCGRGRSLITMAERFPNSRFVGYDLGSDAIAFAQDAARAAGLSNIRFEVRDLTGYDDTNRFDFITTFDAVHDQKDPEGLIRGLYGALRPGGAYLMQDVGGSAHLENNIDFPLAAFLYAMSLTHCMPVSLGQGGAGLGTMWGWETAEAMLEAAGFNDITRTVLPHDPMNVWFVSHKA